ncbi:MAG: FeoA domain-containing protein [Planctomycetaceae bacterium]|nr:FeoA domain-containing protein [Planctomycetaceae bacterium]
MSYAVTEEFVSLDHLPVGGRGTILTLSGDDAVAIRLLELGLLPGEEIEVLGYAPLGDPIAIQVRGTRLALRRKDAGRIHMSVIRRTEPRTAAAVALAAGTAGT